MNVVFEVGVVGQLVNHLNRDLVDLLGQAEGRVFTATASLAPQSLRHEGVEGTAELITHVVQVLQRIEQPVHPVRLLTLSSVLVAFHAIFCFIGALCSPVELTDPDEIESVCEELRLDLHVKLAVAGQTRGKVDLDQPRFEVTIDHDIEAVEFEAVRAVDARLLARREHLILAGKEALHDHVEDS